MFDTFQLQSSDDVAPVLIVVVPEGQVMHAVLLPGWFLYVPLAHGMQDVLCTPLTYTVYPDWQTTKNVLVIIGFP